MRDGIKEKGGKSDEETPPSPLQIDPKCIQDALRAFLQPIKTDDPRLDFYAMYKREATEYDTDYVKKYDEDLNTTLIFAGLFSAVSSAFVIDVHSKLQPDPNDQSAALLRAILFTLNHSAIPGEIPIVPPVQEASPAEIVTVTGLMYASLLISLLAAFVAMLGKQWLNRYLRNAGGSMIERCGDRQRKCDGLNKWPFHLFIESLPVMLQVSLLLLAGGLCRHMWSINHSVAYILVTLTALGVIFYLGILFAGTSSYACPFQTPGSVTLRGLWKIVRPGIDSIVAHRKALSWTPRYLHRQPSPIPLGSVVPLESVQAHQLEAWLKPTALATLRETNVNDVRCVSWILWNITDPEALDAAVRLAGTIRWFEDGLNVEPPYEQIVSTLKACFDSTGKMYSGLRDRAYYSARAILWIHIRAMCKSEEFAHEFSLPVIRCDPTPLDRDLIQLLGVYICFDTSRIIADMYTTIHRGSSSPAHLQWTSNALLHLSWAKRSEPDAFDYIHCPPRTWSTIPPDVMLNQFLVACTLLGRPVEEDALKIQDKSDRFDQILSQFSQAMIEAIHNSHPRSALLLQLLLSLRDSGHRSSRLTKMAYDWCSVVCENYDNLRSGNCFLLVSLEIGFRHLGPESYDNDLELTHTDHHRRMANIIFESGDDEAIADLLHAWTVSTDGGDELLAMCVEHLVSLRLDASPSMLRRLVIRSVGEIGYQGFGRVGTRVFAQFLDGLGVSVRDIESKVEWIKLLVDTVRSPEGILCLSRPCWELLVELTISVPWELKYITSSPRTTTILKDNGEWDKLECWLAIVWIGWPSEGAAGDLRSATLSLFHERPYAIQRLERRMERWDLGWQDLRYSLQQICKQVSAEAVSRYLLPTLLTRSKATLPPRPLPPTPSLSHTLNVATT